MVKYFTVGPSQLYPTVNGHLHEALDNHIPEISHRSPQFKEIYQQTQKNIRTLLNLPSDYSILFYSSATECMERIVQNLSSKSSLHFVCGAFSKRFFNVAYDLGLDARMYQVWIDQNEWFVTKNISKLYNFNPELVCVTYNETSTGTQMDQTMINDIREAFPNTLIAVDCVSSAPAIQLDYSKVDAAFFSTQKLFGLPAGLGVLILSPNAINRSANVKQDKPYSTSYLGVSKMHEQHTQNQTPHTPNVLGIFLLNEVIKDMLILGVDRIYQELHKKAEYIYSHYEKNPKYHPYVQSNRNRSETVIALKTIEPASNIVLRLERKGFLVSTGYGESKEQLIRIANFPATTLTDVQNLCSALDSI